MESEIKLAWVMGYTQAVFDHTTLHDGTKVEKLARKAWQKNCENLTWANPAVPADDAFDFELAA